MKISSNYIANINSNWACNDIESASPLKIAPCAVLTMFVLGKSDVLLISRVQYPENCVQVGVVEQIWPSHITLTRNLQLFQLLNEKLSGIL